MDPKSAIHFTIIEHTVRAQYVREYHHAAKSDASHMRLAVKEYRPTYQPIAQDAMTIVATHANGIVKEAYEPLWEDLCRLLPGKIRAIWFADCTHQGASATLNEGVLGDDPNWFDHSRDLLALINHFRDEMPRPLVGVGHSMGCAQLVQLALLHPRLLDSLVLIEPVIRSTPPPGPNAATSSSYRPDRWPSTAEAEATFRKNKLFRTWDARCLDAFLRHGLRILPDATTCTSTANKGQITLSTSKAQEVWSYIRPNFAPTNYIGEQSPILERRRAPDLPAANRAYQFDRAEMIHANASLPNVRPKILWMFADRSFINAKPDNDDKLERSGTGIGGSGGAEEGNVKAITVANSTHMLPLERPSECAQALGDWLTDGLTRFNEVEKWWMDYDSRKSTQDMTLSKEWMERVKQKEHTPRDAFKGKL